MLQNITKSLDKKPMYGYHFTLNERDSIRLTAAREVGYTIPNIVRLGIEVALKQTQKTDGRHLDEREE
jgi:hypothetical protein